MHRIAKWSGWAITAAAVGAVGAHAKALDPWSFTDRVQQSLRMGAATPDYMTKTGTTEMNANPSDYDQPASFIARVERSEAIPPGAPSGQTESRSNMGYAASPEAYDQPMSFITRVEQNQRVGAPAMLDREDQLSPEQIRLVQRALADKGYSNPVNGQLDEGTRSSLISFQRSHDLPMTGTLDSRTVDALGFDARQVTPVRAPSESR